MRGARLERVQQAAVAAVCGAGWLNVACGEAPPPSPTAVVRVQPASVCHGDDFETLFRLDASSSTPGLTLVPTPASADEPPLEFDWALSGAAHLVEGTDPTGVELQVRTAGDRPLHVQLTVTNAAGGQATSVHSLAVTFLDLVPCALGACDAGSRCANHHDRDVCVPDLSCEIESDCPVCTTCDVAEGRCVPVEAVP